VRNTGVKVTTALLLPVLGAVVGLAVAAMNRVQARTEAVDEAISRLTAFQDVQRSLAGEAFAEAGYRRAPSPAARLRIDSQTGELTTSVARVRRLHEARQDGVVNYLLVLNNRYVAEVRSSVDSGAAHDDRVAGPALDAMQALVDGAVGKAQFEAEVAIADQRRLTNQLIVLGPIALGVALLLVLVCWATLLRQQRGLHGRAERSEEQARRDVLTGVGNRMRLSEVLAIELATPSPDAALVMIDLDEFKAVNDTYGHAAGDVVLRTVATRLTDLVGAEGVVCRMGGDEFAILVRPALSAVRLIGEIRQVLVQPVTFDGDHLPCRGSVGASELRAGQEQSQVLREADEALYAAKRSGRVPAPRSGDDVRHEGVRGDLTEST
jgi:diguanylate cyclase (GGDEF)-like protein